MLAHAKLSKTFWAKMLMTTVYVINRSPSTPLDGDVLQRMWTGKDVSYRHLMVFGCSAYMHVVKDQRGKLDPKSWPCVFLGDGDDEFVYRLWDLVELGRTSGAPSEVKGRFLRIRSLSDGPNSG